MSEINNRRQNLVNLIVNNVIKSNEQVKEHITKGDVTEAELLEAGFPRRRLDTILVFSPEEHMANIRDGAYSLEKIQNLVATGVIAKEALSGYIEHNVHNGVYAADEMRTFIRSGYIDKEVLVQYHYQKIRSKAYNQEYIKGLIERGELHEKELLLCQILSKFQIDEILGRPMDPPPPPPGTGFDTWEELPALLEDRIDVFSLGQAGSGKSAFMAGLFTYAHRIGKLIKEVDNVKGLVYMDYLVNLLSQGYFPPATARDKMQYMPCNFITPTGSQVPLNFIEMSGEVFERCYGREFKDMPENFHSYMTHGNSKVIIMCVDYKVHTEQQWVNVKQSNNFEFLLNFLDKNGTFNYTKTICLLITKWDQSPDRSEEAAVRFIEESYRSLFNACMRIQEKYNLRFAIYPFSLGNVGRRNNCVYDSSDSEKIYNWLCSFLGVMRKEKEKSGWSKLFR